jgi:hypothetical protein
MLFTHIAAIFSLVSAAGASRGLFVSHARNHDGATVTTTRRPRSMARKNKPSQTVKKSNNHRRLQTTPCLSDDEGRWELWVPFGCDDFSDFAGADAMDDLNEILEEEECPHDAATELELVFGVEVFSSSIV